MLTGVCLNPPLIITELLERGSLYTLLHSSVQLSKDDVLKIIKGVANGILPCHTHNADFDQVCIIFTVRK
jgi:hypothetical protein